MKTQTKKTAAAAAALAAAALLAGACPASAQAASAPAACPTTALKASLHPGAGQAGMGNFGEDLALTNTSHRTCTVYGYPGLGLQNSRHAVQPIKVDWGPTYFAPDPGRHTVTLRPGQSAWSDLAWNAPYGEKSVTPSYLEVTPPNQRTYLVIPFAPGAIDDSALHVTALASSPPRT